MGDQCPMHQQHGSGNATVSQADADRCCASSERGDSTPAGSLFASSLTLAVLVSPLPTLMRVPFVAHATRAELAAAPLSPVPKHLLFSTFLV